MKTLTVEITKGESGYIAVVSRGGKLSPLSSFGKKTFAGNDLDKVLADATAKIKESLAK
jgi:hypothetical protein